MGEGMGVVGVKRTHQCWMGSPPCPARPMMCLRRARVWKGQLSAWVGLNQLLLCQAEMVVVVGGGGGGWWWWYCTMGPTFWRRLDLDHQGTLMYLDVVTLAVSPDGECVGTACEWMGCWCCGHAISPQESTHTLPAPDPRVLQPQRYPKGAPCARWGSECPCMASRLAMATGKASARTTAYEKNFTCR